MASIIELLVAGAILGFAGGLLGIGGGVFAIPFLALAFGLDQQHSQGTALVMVVPNVAIGLWRYSKKQALDRRLALSLALPAFPFTFLAAHLATHLPSAPLRIAFAAFVLAIAIFMAYKAFAPNADSATPQRVYPWPVALIVGAFGGALSGLFGVGGAAFSVPLMSLLFGLSQTSAQALGLALVAPGTLVGVATYAWAGDVDWFLGIPLALGALFAVPYGVHLAYRMPERRLRLVFSGLMVCSSILLLQHVG
ncbi:MAG: sulfite exporter TauE/SafE family protein [Candidatus Eremiobacteraeota bacterium]|nr:sulfite exporter TauE/SafE family protein [Candidatus Eremiobacteraeota bacterium]